MVRYTGDLDLRDSCLHVLSAFTFDYVEPSPAAAAAAPAGIVEGKIWSEHAASLVWLDDQPESWPRIFRNASLACGDVVKTYNSGGLARNTQSLAPSQWTSVRGNVHEHLRPRVWYFGVVRCVPRLSPTGYDALVGGCGGGGGGALDRVRVDLHLTNPRLGWEAEFGTDEALILPASAAFAVLFAGLLALQLLGYRRLRRRGNSAYALAGLSALVLAVLLAALACSLVELLLFAQNDFTQTLHEGASLLHNPLRLLASALGALGRVSAFGLVVVLALGWLIDRPALRAETLVPALALLCLQLASTMVDFARATHANFLDPWRSVFGVVAACAQAWLAAHALFATVGRWSPGGGGGHRRAGWAERRLEWREARQRQVYRVVAALCLLWLCSPVALVVIEALVAPWVRSSTVFLVEWSATALTGFGVVFLSHRVGALHEDDEGGGGGGGGAGGAHPRRSLEVAGFWDEDLEEETEGLLAFSS